MFKSSSSIKEEDIPKKLKKNESSPNKQSSQSFIIGNDSVLDEKQNPLKNFSSIGNIESNENNYVPFLGNTANSLKFSYFFDNINESYTNLNNFELINKNINLEISDNSSDSFNLEKKKRHDEGKKSVFLDSVMNLIKIEELKNEDSENSFSKEYNILNSNNMESLIFDVKNDKSPFKCDKLSKINTLSSSSFNNLVPFEGISYFPIKF